MTKYNEGTVEQAALIWLQELSYTHIYGPNIALDEPAAERSSYRGITKIMTSNI
ncbi:MAG: hypothetical protein KDE51_00510 [Anaerolineales bacterium]|nr:hypothetical protein [Anaerolineales bacterium]